VTIQAVAGLLPDEIAERISPEPAFRARQVFKWIASGARDFDSMSNLPLALRASLKASLAVLSTRVLDSVKDADGTVKLQVGLADGYAVETVLLVDREGRKTACVSCQVGCPMGCAFCQTGHVGYARDLDAAEIVGQFYHLEDAVGRLDNIVYMGMGEPLLNLDAVRKSIAILTHPQGRALSRRRITVSTSGLSAGIRDLADNGPDVRLAVSLTVADPALRAELMPVTRSNPLGELREAIRHFAEKTGRRVTLEAALMAGVNTSRERARELADFARGLNVHVNLIPWNPVPTLPFSTPSAEETRRFLAELEALGVNATLRMRRGTSVAGACGQLGRGLGTARNAEPDDGLT